MTHVLLQLVVLHRTSFFAFDCSGTALGIVDLDLQLLTKQIFVVDEPAFELNCSIDFDRHTIIPDYLQNLDLLGVSITDHIHTITVRDEYLCSNLTVD